MNVGKIRSMTGYGRGTAENSSRKITIELRSVNHRYLDILFKLPRNFSFLEDCLRSQLKGKLKRGHIDLYMAYEDNRENKTDITVDTAVAKRYFTIGQELSALGFANAITVADAIKLPEVLIQKSTEDDEKEIENLAKEAVTIALDNLIKMREAEGKILSKDIGERLNNISTITTALMDKAPQISEEYRQTLKQRITEILCEVEYDEARLLNEVAYYAEKVNVDEELTRLKSHIIQGGNMLNYTQPVGRKFDFLVQEMHRETNTVGSKCNDITITQKVLELKAEIEKIREQVQNIE